MKIDFKVRKRTDGDIVTSLTAVYNPKLGTKRYIDYIPRFDLFWIFNYATEKMINTIIYGIDFHDELNEIFDSKLHNYIE